LTINVSERRDKWKPNSKKLKSQGDR
jgi:hypothetical protein